MNIKISKNTLQELSRKYDTVIINGKPTPTWSGILPYVIDNLENSFVKHMETTSLHIYAGKENVDMLLGVSSSIVQGGCVVMTTNNGNVRTNTPTNNSDCATKLYVDTEVSKNKLEIIDLGSAESGTLTSAQLQKIIDDPNKVILQCYGTKYFNTSIAFTDSSTFYVCPLNTNFYRIQIIKSTGRWTRSSYTFEQATYKVNALSSTSTTYQYPSAKCVYDALPHLYEYHVYIARSSHWINFTWLSKNNLSTVQDLWTEIQGAGYTSYDKAISCGGFNSVEKELHWVYATGTTASPYWTTVKTSTSVASATYNMEITQSTMVKRQIF